MAQAPSWNLVGLPACSLISQIACNLPILSRYYYYYVPPLPISLTRPFRVTAILGSCSFSNFGSRRIQGFFQGRKEERKCFESSKLFGNRRKFIIGCSTNHPDHVVWMQFVPLISLHFAISIYFQAGALPRMGFSKEYLPLPSPFLLRNARKSSLSRPCPFCPRLCAFAWNLGVVKLQSRDTEGGEKRRRGDSNRFDLIVLCVCFRLARREIYPRPPDNLTFKLRSW